MAGLDALCATDAAVAIAALCEQWFDIRLPPAPPAAVHPPLLERLWAADAARTVFHAHNQLSTRDAVSERDGCVLVLHENQGIWATGYRPDGTDEPWAVAADDAAALGAVRMLDGVRFDELLYRMALMEAVLGARWYAASEERVTGLDRAGLVRVRPAVAVDPPVQNLALPDVWRAGEVLLFDLAGWIFAGARSREAFEHPSLATFRLDEAEDQGPTQPATPVAGEPDLDRPR